MVTGLTMYIIRLAKTVQMGDQTLVPGVRYVVPSVETHHLSANLAPEDIASSSSWNPYNRPPHEGCRSIAVYRHSAWGDQLMTTGIVKFLRDKFPDARLDVYCAKKMLPIWEYGWADHAYPTPMTFDAATWYDGHVFFDEMLEMNAEPEQGNAYDDMLGFAGFNPAAVDPFYKRPQLKVA